MSSPSADRSTNTFGTEQGVALLPAIIVLTVIGVLVTAGFHSVRQEGRMGAASAHQVRARHLAEDAITGVLANWQGDVYGSLPVGGTSLVSDSTAAGNTHVQLRRTGAGSYFLTGEAQVGLDGFGGALARRRLGLTARLAQTRFLVPSALVAAGAIEVAGSAVVEGADHAPANWGNVCGSPSLTRPGVAHAQGATVSVQDPSALAGSPPTVPDDAVALSATSVFSELTWAELAALADKTLTGGNLGTLAPIAARGVCDRAAPFNWGNPSDPTTPCGAYFPIIHIAGDARLTGGGSGQGILLVDGNLEVLQPFSFHGIVIIRGTLDIAASKAQLYAHVRAHDVILASTGTFSPTRITLSTCAVERAVVNHPMLTRGVPILERRWVDLTALEG